MERLQLLLPGYKTVVALLTLLCCVHIVNSQYRPGWDDAYKRLRIPKEYEHLNFYEVLEVKPDAEPSAIKKQYRALSIKRHPDKHTEDEKKKWDDAFKELNFAYQLLNSPAKRQLYDFLLERQAKEKEKASPATKGLPCDQMYRLDCKNGGSCFQIGNYKSEVECACPKPWIPPLCEKKGCVQGETCIHGKCKRPSSKMSEGGLKYPRVKVCVCKDGYYTEDCSKECDSGKYGKFCLITCSDHCHVPRQCHHVTGKCKPCQPGYTGSKCNKRSACKAKSNNCRKGKCVKPSEVAKIKRKFINTMFKNEKKFKKTKRDLRDGSSASDYSWNSEYNFQEPDDKKEMVSTHVGYLGNVSSLIWPRHKRQTKTPKVCLCKAGYGGQFCDKECIDGTWGITCSETCGQCKNLPCDKKTGKCDKQGCQSETLQPPYCKRNISDLCIKKKTCFHGDCKRVEGHDKEWCQCHPNYRGPTCAIKKKKLNIKGNIVIDYTSLSWSSTSLDESNPEYRQFTEEMKGFLHTTFLKVSPNSTHEEIDVKIMTTTLNPKGGESTRRRRQVGGSLEVEFAATILVDGSVSAEEMQSNVLAAIKRNSEELDLKSIPGAVIDRDKIQVTSQAEASDADDTHSSIRPKVLTGVALTVFGFIIAAVIIIVISRKAQKKTRTVGHAVISSHIQRFEKTSVTRR